MTLKRVMAMIFMTTARCWAMEINFLGFIAVDKVMSLKVGLLVKLSSADIAVKT